MFIFVSGNVARTKDAGDLLQLYASFPCSLGFDRIYIVEFLLRAAIVQNVDMHLPLRVCHLGRGDHGSPDDGRVFVIGWYVDIHAGHQRRVMW